jgi:hypothetical protein
MQFGMLNVIVQLPCSERPIAVTVANKTAFNSITSGNLTEFQYRISSIQR